MKGQGLIEHNPVENISQLKQFGGKVGHTLWPFLGSQENSGY